MLVVLTPVSASAAVDLVITPVTLPLHGVMTETAVHDMKVDAADKRIFISGGHSSKVVELSLGGTILHTAKVAGAGDMAVVGSTLYVGSCTTSTVTRLSVADLTVLGSFNVASGMPCNLAALDGELWFTPNDSSTLESVRIASPHTTATYPSIDAGVIAASPPSTLYTASTGTDTLNKVDVSSTPAVVGSAVEPQVFDISVNADGSRILISQGGFSRLYDNNMNDLGVLSEGEGVFSADGQSVGFGFGPFGVHPAASDTPTLTLNLPQDYSQHESEQANHIAFSPDGTKLYVAGTILGDYTKTPITGVLYIVDIPATPSYISAIGACQSCMNPPVGTTQDINGSITTVPGNGLAGRTVDAALTDPNGNPVSVPSATTDGTGAFDIQTPPLDVAGVWKVHLTLEASGDYRGATADAEINAVGTFTKATVTRSATSVIYGNQETITATLSQYAANVTMVEIHRVRNGTDTVIGSGTVDAGGQFAFSFTPSRSAHYYVEHPGDATYDPAASAQVPVGVIPVINGKWSSKHGTKGSYAIFTYHSSCASSGSKCPQFTEHLAPSEPGMTVYLAVQAHTSSGWRTVAGWHKKLNSHSNATFSVRYGNSSVIGHQYRLIAASKKTADFDASGWGYWYFKIMS